MPSQRDISKENRAKCLPHLSHVDNILKISNREPQSLKRENDQNVPAKDEIRPLELIRKCRQLIDDQRDDNERAEHDSEWLHAQ